MRFDFTPPECGKLFESIMLFYHPERGGSFVSIIFAEEEEERGGEEEKEKEKDGTYSKTRTHTLKRWWEKTFVVLGLDNFISTTSATTTG